ncbi:MAG: Octaprenyl diphosphate synthase (EC / Dimethylallyltransferase (EC / (2E,6E)-farnesyl diphosphate synthase (EC / Geranylgeranyl pyrophosphate synthetase (EC [uncultured Sulfurovum sp.]|uniref:Octaprenyl diphosphate synthase -farnesyl diphosphate synthase ))) n=1 Tax=uncultured Sulfurovum sp. TaxID=269237 RepID=A0A6S6UI03_9BACT|nr:MAG: Octaprenyl diphosphate synthase (EC / Dimethylallyltransferase (EC / (2E,6E)-farnesyl diphosphate synthase (EC / Geranylgeranyl pyrophosphate synthetase (EC [uncultured Sulfurovum sp.]
MLSAVERKIGQFVEELDDKEVSALYAKLPHGKRLRAKLILKIAGTSLPVIKTAAVVEMIHAASLLHDDVIDDAYTRRSKPSLNALYGNKTAIMLGDILYAKGFFELNNISPEISKMISNSVVQLSLGELKDVSLSKSFNIDKKIYLEMIYQKTASLMEACAGAAALLANKDPKAYKIYGRNLGIAFQMIDDILDITMDTQTLGKPSLHDFVEGKTTLPYIYLYEALDDENKLKLKSLHGKKLSDNNTEWIMLMMQENNIIKKSYQEAKTLIEEAITLMNERGENALSHIAMAMIERDF